MASANIVISQGGAAAPAGQSNDQLSAGTPVTLTNEDDTGVRYWRWQLIDTPRGSSATLSVSSGAVTQFTPDVPGTYLIRLTVNGGQQPGEVQQRIGAVRDYQGGTLLPAIGFRIMGAGEEQEANWPAAGGNGYYEDLVDLLKGMIDVYAIVNSTGGAITEPVVTASNTPTPVPGFQDFTMALGQSVLYVDTAPADPIRLYMPPIGINTGRRIGLVLPLGNPNVDVVWSPDPADAVLYFSSTLYPPGSGTFTIPAGTYGAPTVLVLQSVLNGAGPGVQTWMPDYNTADTVVTWADALSNGNVSGANSALVNDEQVVEWGYPDPAPGGNYSRGFRTARRYEDASPSVGTETMGGAVVTELPASSVSCYATVRLSGLRREGDAVSSTTTHHVLEQVWDMSTGVLVRTVVSDGSGFSLAMSGTDLVAQVAVTGTDPVDAIAMIDVTFMPGFPGA